MALIHKKQLEDQTRLGVWKIDESTDHLKSMLILSDDEELFYRSIHHEMRKKQWLSYRIILKELLGTETVHIQYTEHGKPVLQDSRVEFSVSHSGIHSAAIISPDRKVGIDIEQLRERIFRVSSYFLSAGEIESIGPENRLEKYYICWGAKEALYKLHGKPEVEFRRDIHIESFDYLCDAEGTCQARLKTLAGVGIYNIYYNKIGDYMLVYALGNSKS